MMGIGHTNILVVGSKQEREGSWLLERRQDAWNVTARKSVNFIRKGTGTLQLALKSQVKTNKCTDDSQSNPL